MRKTYVLDTSAIITDPDIFNSFEENEVIIPLAVLKELDRQKAEYNTERGQKARKAIRALTAYREAGDILLGVGTPGGGFIRFVVEAPEPIHDNILDNNSTDMQVVAIAKDLGGIVVSNDLALCAIASAVGVPAETYRAKNVDFNGRRYAGLEVYLDATSFEKLLVDGHVKVDRLDRIDGETEEPLVNQGLILYTYNSNATLLGRYLGNGVVKFINTRQIERKVGAYLVPRNAEQWFALDLLMDPEIQLVNLAGIAGAGKTLLTLAAGCLQTIENGPYSKLAITKSVVAFGKQDIGFLPGDVGEKMGPYVANMVDHLNNLLGKEAKMFIGDQIIIEPLAYIRGKSLDDTFLLVDESQNLSEEDLLTILTRAGNNTKIVLTGDPTQCDAPYLNAYNNGLTRVIRAFENQSIAGTAILTNSQRQTLARLAAQLLGTQNNFWTQDR